MLNKVIDPKFALPVLFLVFAGIWITNNVMAVGNLVGRRA